MRNIRCVPRWVFCSAIMIGLATVSLAEEPNKELVGLIINLLSDPDKDVRGLGFDQVRSEAKGSAATERFSAQLPKLSHDAQAGLLSALADRGDPAARPGVRELLSASDSEPSEEKGTGVIS